MNVASSQASLDNEAGGMISLLLRQFRHSRKARPYADFIPFKETLAAAKAAGVSVGEYIERKHLAGARTALDQTVDGLASLGLFDAVIQRICEIGPGSGRYLEKIMARCQPQSYEIYETSREWRNWLVGEYGVIPRACNGRTLAATESSSVDLVHAHKVFGGGLPFLNTMSYWGEMARVVRGGGWVVFDIMTEACFSRKYLDEWFNANPWEWAWSPHMIGRDFTIATFNERGISLVGSFLVPSFPAITECMVFRKTLNESNQTSQR